MKKILLAVALIIPSIAGAQTQYRSREALVISPPAPRMVSKEGSQLTPLTYTSTVVDVG